MVLKKFEKCEDEHHDALKRLNQRITEIKQEMASTRSSTSYSGHTSRASQATKSNRSSTTSALERKADIAAKVAKLKTELTFADAEARKTAALREQQEELKKLKLSKKLALAQAEMDAVNRVEDSTSGVCDRQDIFPETTDTRDLLQEYLSTQAQSVPMVSLPTLETEVESTSEPMVTLKDKMNTSQLQCDSHAERNRYSSITPPTDPVAIVSHYPSALNPFAPEYTTVSTPKYVYPFSPPSVPFEDVSPSKSAFVPHQDSSSGPPNPSSSDALERLADLLSQRRLQDSLPLPEPETFRGDLLRYPSWLKSFETIIEGQTDKVS